VAGIAAGAAAGWVSYQVTRSMRAWTQTKREFREHNPKGSFFGALMRDPQTKQRFAQNREATANNKAKWTSVIFGAAVGGVFAAYGEEILGFAAEKANEYGVADAWNNTVGQVSLAGLTGWLPDLGFGGGAPDTVADPTLNDALAGTTDNPLITDGAADGAADPLDPFGGAGDDVTDAVADAPAADLTIPAEVDADLKAAIIEAARENGTTAYEASIIARLEDGTIGQQVQAAKDFSQLAVQAGDMDMAIQILENLDKDFGNFALCSEAFADSTLAEAVAQVNADLGILQFIQLTEAGVTDAANNADLNAAIVNLMQGAEGGNEYAQRFLSNAEKCFPEAFAAAQGEFATLSDGFRCAATGADGSVIAEPEWGPDCDDKLEAVAPAAAAPEPVADAAVTAVPDLGELSLGEPVTGDAVTTDTFTFDAPFTGPSTELPFGPEFGEVNMPFATDTELSFNLPEAGADAPVDETEFSYLFDPDCDEETLRAALNSGIPGEAAAAARVLNLTGVAEEFAALNIARPTAEAGAGSLNAVADQFAALKTGAAAVPAADTEALAASVRDALKMAPRRG
jgi:hypothetical protein